MYFQKLILFGDFGWSFSAPDGRPKNRHAGKNNKKHPTPSGCVRSDNDKGIKIDNGKPFAK